VSEEERERDREREGSSTIINIRLLIYPYHAEKAIKVQIHQYINYTSNNNNNNFGIVPYEIKFTPTFTKIGRLVQKLLGGKIQEVYRNIRRFFVRDLA
jgi:hypothetical protein